MSKDTDRESIMSGNKKISDEPRSIEDAELKAQLDRFMSEKLSKLKSQRHIGAKELAEVLSRRAQEVAQRRVFEPAPGQSYFVADPVFPGKIVEIRPDGSLVPGAIINGNFVPDQS